MPKTAIATGLAALIDAFGESGTYTPPTGSALTGVTYRVNSVQSANDANHGNRSDLRTADLRVLQAAVPLPEIGGRFTGTGTENEKEAAWVVTERPILRNGQWLCKVESAPLRRMNAPQGGVTS